MFERLADARDALKEVVGSLDPDTLEGASATHLVEEFAAIERLAAAGKALCAKRVADSGAWRRDGDRSPARWMARTTGTSVGNALGVLETAEQMRGLHATETALRSGELSEVQAKEIVSAAAASPADEPELWAVAKAESVSELKERCASVRAAACPGELDRHEAIRKRRILRHFRDPDGAFHLDAVLTPDAGAVVVAALEPYTERALQTARRQGLREPHAVRAVAHLGRTIPARLRTAVEIRDRTCVVPGCDVRSHLEIDHINPVAQGGLTRLDNLARLCRWHHYLKTHRGYRLTGGPGSWNLESPHREPPQTGKSPGTITAFDRGRGP